MKLEFIYEVNEYGDQLIRLYDFDMTEAAKFRDAIKKTILEENQSLDLTTLDFIQPVNCKLIFHIEEGAEEDAGIMTQDNLIFFCDLSIEGYKKMVQLIEPFCNKNLRNFQMLYDLDTQIDLLFSPYGEWAKED